MQDPNNDDEVGLKTTVKGGKLPNLEKKKKGVMSPPKVIYETLSFAFVR